MNKKRIKFFSVLSLVLVIGICFGIKHYHSNSQAPENKVVVEVASVTAGNIPIQAKAVGTLNAAHSIEITPEFTGKVSQIFFTDGSFVKKGTLLIQLADEVYQSKVDSAKAALFYSETNYKRMYLLGKQGVIARQAIESAQADLKEKQAVAQESQVTLDKMHLTAPFDGVLGKARVSPGNYVAVGQPLVNLTDIQHLRVEYSVSEKYLSQLKLGQSVTITTNAYPGKEFLGKIAYISPTINAEDRTISLYADIPNDDRLLTAGLFVNVVQSLGMQEQAVLIPSESVVATIDGQKVFKIVSGKAISVPVKIGQRNVNNVQILSGLSQGDIVVTAGQEKLKDGTTVDTKR
jgi:membrane fusion protein (multidrug efflux system)